MGEAHRPAKTHRLMRALQQRQGEAAPTEGAAAEQQEERAAEQTVTAGTGAGMGPHTVGNGATPGVGQPSVEGQGRKRKATTGLRTTSDEEQMANAAAAPSEEWSAEMEQQELETQAKKKKKRLKQTGKRSFRPTQHRRQQATAAAAAAAAEPGEERDGGTKVTALKPLSWGHSRGEMEPPARAAARPIDSQPSPPQPTQLFQRGHGN